MRNIYPMRQKTQRSKQKLDMALRSIDELHDIKHSLCDVLTIVSKASFDSSLQITSVPLSIPFLARAGSTRPDASRNLTGKQVYPDSMTNMLQLRIPCDKFPLEIVHGAGPQIQIRCRSCYLRAERRKRRPALRRQRKHVT
jgi:hypothetical protein